MSVVSFNSDKCSGCWACTMTCVDQNDIQMSSADSAFRLVMPVEKRTDAGYKFSYEMHGCLHCEDPECMKVCPCECYSIADNGLVILDNSQCIGCGLCADECKHHAIIIRNNLASKCDGCAGRLAMGLRPACERICPTGALCFKV